MKKKFLSILAVIVAVGVISGQAVFAAGQLELVSAFPEDGGTGYQTMNQMARLVFNHPVTAEGNEDCFQVLDAEGKEQSIMVLEQEDEPERINLLFENELQQNAEYKIVIDASFTDEEGNSLGEDVEISFRTKNTKTESLVTTGLMIVMFVVIIFITIKEQAKQQSEQQDSRNKKVNPYKEAKKEAEKMVAQKKKERNQKVSEYQRQNAQKQKNKKK